LSVWRSKQIQTAALLNVPIVDSALRCSSSRPPSNVQERSISAQVGSVKLLIRPAVRTQTTDIQQIEAQAEICGDPGAIAWNYSRAETIADLAVHVTGLCFGCVAATVLLTHAARHAATMNILAASIYSLGLLSMLAFSAAYNLWPICPTKWWLRRLDQSAIYILIAATYTAFVVDTKAGTTAICVLVGIWCLAALGIAAALALPGRLDRTSIGAYIGMGWSVVVLWRANDMPVSLTTFQLLVAGGALVMAGLIFHVWRGLKFQIAIWHLFVLLAIACHYAAVLSIVLGHAAT
jgi:hemolysin III